MSIAVVIANGPNWLEIPVLVFPAVWEAENHLNSISFLERRVTQKGQYGVAPEEVGASYWYFPEGSAGENTEESHPDLKKLFKDGNYYDGCGGVSFFTIKEFDFGVPMVGWDLD